MNTHNAQQHEIATPGGMRNEATRAVALVLGVTAGLLGLEHGYFETRQGNLVPDNFVISAIGPPCQPSQAWHACEPAMTVIPNLLITGVLAIICSLVVLLWAAMFVQREQGGFVLILLAIALALVGGGFVTLLFGLVAGAAGTRIHAPLVWWRAHLSHTARRLLASVWPWTLVALLLWFPVEGVIASISNNAMLRLGPIMTAMLPALLLVFLVAGFAHDLQRHQRRADAGVRLRRQWG
jgi:hypothetical protein